MANVLINIVSKFDDKGIKQTESALGRLGGFARSPAGLGIVGLGAGIATGLGAAAVASLSLAQDMDQNLANIAAVMNRTKDEVQPLKDVILDLSLNPNLVVDATQAAQAIEMLAKNGLKMDDIIGGAAEATVALANATGNDFVAAADISTDVMAQFNVKADQMGKVIDGITGVTTNSKFSINDYALALAQSGGVASGMGVSLEDLNTTMAATSSSFASGSDAGTSFKTFLQKMANPLGQTEKAMSSLSLSLFDSNGQMKDMATIAGELNAAFVGMTEAERAEMATKLGGADASRTVLALASMTKDEFLALGEAVNASGQATESASTRMDTLSGAWEIASGQMQGIGLTIGDALMPTIRDAVEGFIGFAEVATPVIAAWAESFGVTLGQAAIVVADAMERIGPAIGLTGENATASEVGVAALGKALGVLTSAVEAVAIGAKIFADLTESISKALQIAEDLRDMIAEIFSYDFGTIASAIDSTLGMTGPGGDAVFNPFGAATGNEGGAVFNPFGFASGGTFTVGGSGGPDSQLVAFRANPGEQVTINTPGQANIPGIDTGRVSGAVMTAAQKIAGQMLARFESDLVRELTR